MLLSVHEKSEGVFLCFFKHIENVDAHTIKKNWLEYMNVHGQNKSSVKIFLFHLIIYL